MTLTADGNLLQGILDCIRYTSVIGNMPLCDRLFTDYNKCDTLMKVQYHVVYHILSLMTSRRRRTRHLDSNV